MKDVSILINNESFSEELNLYEVGYEKCRPAKPSEYAPIDYWVLHYCVAGEGYFSTEEMAKEHITAGDLFLIPAFTKNMYFPKKENPWSYRWVGISGSCAEDFLASGGLDNETCIINSSIDTKLHELFEDIYLSFKNNRNFLAMSHLYLLFDYLAERAKKGHRLTQGEQVYQNILNYINNHYTQNITIEEVAQVHNIDRTYLFKLFKKYQQLSPSAYLQELRFKKACSLLRKSSLNITEISFEVGFSSASYFSKFFLNQMGVTPMQYRKQFVLTFDNEEG